MGISDTHKRKLRKLEPRNWRELASMWNSYLPTVDPLTAPDDEIGELLPLRTELRKTDVKHPNNVVDDLPGVRQAILKDALFTMQKACFYFSASRSGISNQFGCPSISNVYQAAFFGAKALISILGVTCISRPGESHYIVDVFSDRIEGSKTIFGYNHYTRIVNFEGSINHKELWAILIKLLSITSFEEDLIESFILEAIGNVDVEDFGLQRHRLHYRLAYWPFDEFRTSTMPTGYSNYEKIEQAANILGQPESTDFSFALSTIVIYITRRLIYSLDGKLVPLNKSISCLDSFLSNETVF